MGSPVQKKAGVLSHANPAYNIFRFRRDRIKKSLKRGREKIYTSLSFLISSALTSAPPIPYKFLTPLHNAWAGFP
jgi:hypothetical protein